VPEPKYSLPSPDFGEIVETEESASEELAFRMGRDLKARKTSREIQKLLHDGDLDDHLHRLVVCGMYVVALAAFAMFFTLIWHLVTPYPFLADEKIADIKQFLFSGALGAGISTIAKNKLARSEAE